MHWRDSHLGSPLLHIYKDYRGKIILVGRVTSNKIKWKAQSEMKPQKIKQHRTTTLNKMKIDIINRIKP